MNPLKWTITKINALTPGLRIRYDVDTMPDNFSAAARQIILPNDLESAHKEIVSLRNQLVQANQKRAEAFERYNLDKKSLVSQLNLLRQMAASPGGPLSSAGPSPAVVEFAADAAKLLEEARDRWVCGSILKNQRLLDLIDRAVALGLLSSP